MISRTKVNTAIDKAETEFKICWTFLQKMKGAKSNIPTANEILSFQPRLAESIFKLTELYRKLHQEKKYFIKRKPIINEEWFKKRLSTIKDYQEAVSTTIAIGKALGDAFVWFFYHKERNALVEHLKHERIFYAPPGVGGIGELEFIKRMQVINGYLVLYNGITNLLRLGDLSFIDLKTLELAGIAELKTKQVGREKIEIDFLLKGKEDKLRKALEKLVDKSIQSSEIPEFNPPPYINQKLKEQLQQIENSFKIIPSYKDHKIEVKANTDEFEKLFEDVNTKQTAFNKVGKGQVLARLNLPGKTLSSRLLGNSSTDWTNEFAGIEELISGILIERSSDNRLYVDSLHNPSPKRRIMPGVIPLFWWSTNLAIIERILFHNSLLISSYNPASFIEGLRKLGCEVEVTEKGYDIKKKFGNSYATVEGVRYFIELIVGQFYPEESILEMIDHTLKTIEEENVAPGTRVEIRFFEMFSQ